MRASCFSGDIRHTLSVEHLHATLLRIVAPIYQEDAAPGYRRTLSPNWAFCLLQLSYLTCLALILCHYLLPYLVQLSLVDAPAKCTHDTQEPPDYATSTDGPAPSGHEHRPKFPCN